MSKIKSILGNQTTNYLITISMKISFSQSVLFIKSFCVIYLSLMIYMVSPNFDYANPIIIKVIFSVPKFVSACKKSALYINSFLRWSRF